MPYSTIHVSALAHCIRKTKHHATLAAMALLMAGCGGLHPVTVPDAIGKQAHEVATVTVVEKENTVTSIAVVFDARGREIQRGEPWFGTGQMTLLPGNYEIVFKVLGGYQQLDAFPRAFVKLEPGRTYHAASYYVNGRSAVQVKVWDAATEAAEATASR
jgi:hypothetical protein